MTKNSHLFALFALAIGVTTLFTNAAFHKFGWDKYNEIHIGSLSVVSAKTFFELEHGASAKGILGIPKVVKNNTKPVEKEPPKEEEEEMFRPIELLMPQKDIDWIRRRNKTFHEVYFTRDEQVLRDRRWKSALLDPNKHQINATTGYTNYDEDKDRVWIDFLIAGHPKTGTTTLVANLAKVAPMKVKDFCAPKPSTILNFVVRKWPVKFPEIMDGPNKYVSDKSLMLVGSKCPQFIGNPELLSRYTLSHPRMKLIIGIRHPVEWFNSFIRMGHKGNLYKLTKICPHYANIDPISGIPGGLGWDNPVKRQEMEFCINECRCGLPICLHRARLHIALARVGKTALSSTERNLLAPGDPDGGENLFDAQTKNPIFVYDQAQMKEDSYWDELAGFMGLNYIPNEHYHSARGAQVNTTLCTPFYDQLRSTIMEHSYNMSVWLEEYFLPVGLDPNRPDVTIANPGTFRKLIQTYKIDPCGRLVRNERDGKYVLDSSLWVGNHPTNFDLHAHEVEPCRPKFHTPKKDTPNGQNKPRNNNS